MNRKCISALILVLLLTMSCFPLAGARKPVRLNVFAKIAPTHPRLIVSEDTFEEIEKSAASDPAERGYLDELADKGEKMLSQAPVKYHEGKILDLSRTVLKRVETLALLYSIDHKKQWLERAEAELNAACSFPNWHPQHFLDTAEMMTAVSIGYDWLFSSLPHRDKERIRAAIVKMGLLPAQDAYEHNRYFWVTDTATNWNIVCNGGILMACFALGADQSEYSQLVDSVSNEACLGLAGGMQHYGEDGSWDEGPMYWDYATKYATMAIASAKSATGSDLDLAKVTGFHRTGRFALAEISPLNLLFNFADATEPAHACPSFFWLAKEFDQPALAFKEREFLLKDASDVSPLDLVWYDKEGSFADLNKIPTAQHFAGKAQVVSIRTDWQHPDAPFVGFKGGSNPSHHSHLELGTFVYESMGHRWAMQLGPDNYELPGYFSTGEGAKSQRWQYYRNGTQGQNTLFINDENQSDHAEAVISGNQLDRRVLVNYALADLTEAYHYLGMSSLRRGVALNKRSGALLVQDEVLATHRVKPVWQMHTKADVAVEGRGAMLSFGKDKLSAQILAPKSAHFMVSDLTLKAPQMPTRGIRKLTIELDKPVSKATIVVLLAPAGDRSEPLNMVMPVSDWETKFAPHDE